MTRAVDKILTNGSTDHATSGLDDWVSQRKSSYDVIKRERKGRKKCNQKEKLRKGVERNNKKEKVWPPFTF